MGIGQVAPELLVVQNTQGFQILEELRANIN